MMHRSLLGMAEGRAKATPDPGLKPPQERAYWEVVDAILTGHNVVLQAPTGGGKTRISSELMRWAQNELGGGSFYINRKALVGQTLSSFEGAGLSVGVRASEWDDKYDPYCPVQISSADTERVRVYGEDRYWGRHSSGLVVVDEAHIQKGDTMKMIMNDHISSGAQVVLLSATPVSLRKMLPNPKLVVAGRISEFRACGLLVPAVCKSIEQPDLSKVKRNQTGEYILNGKKKKIYTQSIVGSVIDRWRMYNPDARPTMLYAPGKPESVWFTEQFHKAGVPWCHVDATEAYFDGKRYTLHRTLWEEILGKYRDGTLKGISSRFKCLDMHTEVLTRRGWVSGDDISEDDQVAGVGLDGAFQWESPSRIVRKFHDGPMCVIKSSSIDIRVTDDHELLYRSVGCQWKKTEACNLAERASAYQIPVACTQRNETSVPLSDHELALIGWMMTDGHFGDDGRWSITQSTSKPEWFHSHIRDTLQGCNIDWQECRFTPSIDGVEYDDAIRYIIPAKRVKQLGLSLFASKDFSPLLMDMSLHQLEVMLYAINLGDGSHRKQPSWTPRTLEIAKGNVRFLSSLQSLCVSRGMRANLHLDRDCPMLYVTPGRSHAVIRGMSNGDNDGHSRVRMSIEKQPEGFTERVWCVTVPSGNIITRRNGKVAVVGNCREGIDLPTTYHVILATPIGSLSSYIQTVGRALRAAPNKDHALITDHGGNYLRHGSPNHDRPWEVLWGMSQSVASKMHENDIRNRDAKEPIRCPKCEGERLAGIVCPHCGHTHSKSQREVLMEDGRLVTQEGDLIPKKRTLMRHDTQRKWDDMYWGFKRKRLNRTFAQMEAFFVKEYGYWPPRTLKNMPVSRLHWHSLVCDVPVADLRME